MRTFYERLFYVLCLPAFTRQRLAGTWENQRRYAAAKLFFLLWHGIYGALLAGGLYRLGSSWLPGWVLLTGAVVGLLAAVLLQPGKARLMQFRKQDSEPSASGLRRFGLMLLAYGFLLASLLGGWLALLWLMQHSLL